MSSYEHVFPPKRHVASLLLNIKHLGSLSILSPFVLFFDVISLSLMISFDVISLSPFDINFQEGLSGIHRIGLVLEIQYKAGNKTVMLVEDKIH